MSATFFEFHKLYTAPETTAQIGTQCRNAEIGCVACKKIMAEDLVAALKPIHEKRAYFEARPDMVDEIMIEGSRKAGKIAQGNHGTGKRCP